MLIPVTPILRRRTNLDGVPVFGSTHLGVLLTDAASRTCANVASRSAFALLCAAASASSFAAAAAASSCSSSSSRVSHPSSFSSTRMGFAAQPRRCCREGVLCCLWKTRANSRELDPRDPCCCIWDSSNKCSNSFPQQEHRKTVRPHRKCIGATLASSLHLPHLCTRACT